MLNKIYKFFSLFIFFSIIIFLFFITFNNNLRKQTLNSILNGYKVYMVVSTQALLKQPEIKYDLINKKLIGFIDMSKKISSGNSRLITGVYDAAKLVQSSIIDDKNFGELEQFYFSLSKLDTRLYDAKIWYAKSLFANGKIDDALREVNKAIDISPLDPEPYRLALKILLSQNYTNDFNFYCQKYLTSEFGGKDKRFRNMKFYGFNLNNFGARFNTQSQSKSNPNNIYVHNGISLDKFEDYEITPDTSKNLESIDLIFAFNPGTVLEIENLKLYSKNSMTNVEEGNLIITTKNSFFNNYGKIKQIVFLGTDEEVVTLKLKSIFKDIDKIVIKMKFSKLSLTNNKCQNNEEIN